MKCIPLYMECISYIFHQFAKYVKIVRAVEIKIECVIIGLFKLNMGKFSFIVASNLRLKMAISLNQSNWKSINQSNWKSVLLLEKQFTTYILARLARRTSFEVHGLLIAYCTSFCTTTKNIRKSTSF